MLIHCIHWSAGKSFIVVVTLHVSVRCASKIFGKMLLCVSKFDKRCWMKSIGQCCAERPCLLKTLLAHSGFQGQVLCVNWSNLSLPCVPLMLHPIASCSTQTCMNHWHALH